MEFFPFLRERSKKIRRVYARKIFGRLWDSCSFGGIFGVSFAVNQYMNDFNTAYGTQATALNSCTLCHTGSPTARNLNSYANDYVAYGYDFAAIEALDSDGDGYTNSRKSGGSFPGDAASVPAVKKSPYIDV